MTRARLALGALVRICLGTAALLLGGCAAFVPQSEAIRTNWPADLAAKTELDSVPFFPQKDFQCGPAALATAIAFRGVAVAPDDLVSRVYLPERRGSLQLEMLAAARAYGLVSMPIAPQLDDVLREVQAGNPVIVLQDYGVWPLPYWHYAVLIGYDRDNGRVVLRSGETRRLEMPMPVLEYTWKESRYWAMVVMPPDRVPVTATEHGWLAAVTAMERVASREAVRAAYEAALRRWPEGLNSAIGLANAHYRDGRLAPAEEVLRAALLRHPKSVLVLNNLAQVVSDQRRHDEALALIDEAVAQGGPFAAAAQATRAQIVERQRIESARGGGR